MNNGTQDVNPDENPRMPQNPDASPGRWRRVLTRVAVATVVSAGAMTSFGAAHADTASGDPTPTIIGGQPADQSYGFLVSLQEDRNGDPNTHDCSGALIHKDWVVTAAHCVTEAGTGSKPYTVKDPALFHVRVGSNDRTTGGSVAKLNKIVVNPDYHWFEDHSTGHDMALLHLARAVPEKTVAQASKITKPGTEVREVGWGYTSVDDSDPSQLPKKLRQLDTKTIPSTTKKCQADPKGDDSWGIRKGDICADNPDGIRGPCGGDSGSPLLSKVAGRWQIAGVDSRGVGDTCGTAPDVYTSVGYYHNWISSVTG